jgi:HD-GYP domain-containing protein (c-di-GMP phosphodiesterase class II)
MSKWPDNFDLNDMPGIKKQVTDFIDLQMGELKAFDSQRESWVKANMPADYEMTYRFYDHAYRVANDMKKAALHMGLSALAANNLYLAMLPHDIGKKLLPVYIWDILEKPEDDIKHLRRSHTELGAKIVAQELPLAHPFVHLMTDIMLNHHEQVDGQGFRGVAAEDLSAPVRLAAIVESFDGWSIARPHFGSRDTSPEAVLNRMRTEKIHMFDKELFEAFAEMKMIDHETIH